MITGGVTSTVRYYLRMVRARRLLLPFRFISHSQASSLSFLFPSLSLPHHFHSIITLLTTKIMQVGHFSNSASSTPFTPTPTSAITVAEYSFELVL